MRDESRPQGLAQLLQTFGNSPLAALSSGASSATKTDASCFASAQNIRKESGSGRADYVQAVLDWYLWLPGASIVASRHDRRCALEFHRRGFPIEVVKSAMAVATARRTFRCGEPLPRVRALAYFLPAIEELLEVPCDPDYVQYLIEKLRPLAAEKLVAGGRSRVRRREPTVGRESPNYSVSGRARL